jgi:hypothetical protein
LPAGCLIGRKRHSFSPKTADYGLTPLPPPSGTATVIIKAGSSTRDIAIISVRTDCIRGGTIEAWWFNPRTGKASRIGKFSKTPRREFTPPDVGEALDWVLVLDDAAMEFPPPGTAVRVHSE